MIIHIHETITKRTEDVWNPKCKSIGHATAAGNHPKLRRTPEPKPRTRVTGTQTHVVASLGHTDHGVNGLQTKLERTPKGLDIPRIDFRSRTRILRL